MPRVAPRVPELSEILCSSCGYVLNGLPHTAACPECGQPIAQSLDANRAPPVWESADSHGKASGFFITTLQIISRPGHFYRTLTVRGPLPPARCFAGIHWWIASVLFGLTGATHAIWFYSHVSSISFRLPGGIPTMFALLFFGLTLLTYLTLLITTTIAARLTTLEATYRGYRLPIQIVLRGMYYHAAHYLPVALLAIGVVEGYQLLLHFAAAALPFDSPIMYLWCLCGVVVLCAIYLFQTYWISMRSMMYANR